MAYPTLGESTRRRLSAAIHGAGAGGAEGGGRTPGVYVGGYAGGLGGTWGKAATNRGGQPGMSATPPPSSPLFAGGQLQYQGGSPGLPDLSPAQRPYSAGPGGAHRSSPIPANDYAGISDQGRGGAGGGSGHSPTGRRERIRPNSLGVKSQWDQSPKPLPKAPPFGLTTSKARPQSASMARTTKFLPGVATVEYKLTGTGLMPDRPASAQRPITELGGGGGGAGGGAKLDGSFPGHPSSQRRAPPAYAAQAVHQAVHSGSGEQPGAAAATAAGLQQQEAVSEVPVTQARLSALEDMIRDQLREQRSVYTDSKEMLSRLFKEVDDGSGDVSTHEFVAVCGRLGISATLGEVAALFQRFGYHDGILPYQKFAHVLLTQPSRMLASEMPTRKGAFVAGQSAAFQGKIIYPQCRKAVYTPSDWDPALAARSAELPDARLNLEFVYGYNGKDNSAQNAFYNAAGQLVYYVAGVAVVYSKPPAHSQYFFLGHDDDITSLAMCPAAVKVKGLEYPASTLCASGQVSSKDNGPQVCIWDSRVGSQGGAQELVRWSFDKEYRGITALSFSPDGRHLVAVATDNGHTVHIYDWRNQRAVCKEMKGQMGEPVQVFGVEWNPHAAGHEMPAEFLTFGRNHIKVWREGANGQWAASQMSFGKLPMQDVHTAAWLPPRAGKSECLVVGGMADGQLYVFKGTAAIKAISAHRPGPKLLREDGKVSFGGVRGMRLIHKGAVLLTGGADGVIVPWDVSDGSLADARLASGAITLRSPYGAAEKPPSIRALDFNPASGQILVGTGGCDVMEVTETTQQVLVYGHSANVWGVAVHPTKANTAATVADSSRLWVWDLDARDMCKTASLGFVSRAVAFSTTPREEGGSHHIAVGGEKGNIAIVNEADLRPIHTCKDSTQGISAISYSPDGRLMAVATFDQWIDVYSVDRHYAKVSRCNGHSATVKFIDWTTDSSIIKSVSADSEVLYWTAKSGKQVPLTVRDFQLATYTGTLGFEVMGIFPDYTDNTDINCVDRSHGPGGDQFVVTTDDFGLVKLFNYPCVVQDAPYRAYVGHSSHVMAARFNCNDTKVCSVGGRDKAMFQFRFTRLEPAPPEPAPPQPVWGPLDPEGKKYGYTTTPAQLRTGGSGPASSSSHHSQGPPAAASFGSPQGAGFVQPSPTLQTAAGSPAGQQGWPSSSSAQQLPAREPSLGDSQVPYELEPVEEEPDTFPVQQHAYQQHSDPRQQHGGGGYDDDDDDL